MDAEGKQATRAAQALSLTESNLRSGCLNECFVPPTDYAVDELRRSKQNAAGAHNSTAFFVAIRTDHVSYGPELRAMLRGHSGSANPPATVTVQPIVDYHA